MKRKIINPYKKEQHFCFGCSPFNEGGLKMEFYEEDGAVICEWMPRREFTGFGNIIHGGIQATMIDEIANWVICAQCGTSGVTSTLATSYKKPLIMGSGTIRIVGKVKEQNRRFATIEAEIYDQEGQLCATGEAKYFLFDPAVAREKYFYPGQEAFFE